MGYRVCCCFLERVLKDKGHSEKFPRLWPRISETIKARHRNAMDELEKTWNAPGLVRGLAADKGSDVRKWYCNKHEIFRDIHSVFDKNLWSSELIALGH